MAMHDDQARTGHQPAPPAPDEEGARLLAQIAECAARGDLQEEIRLRNHAQAALLRRTALQQRSEEADDPSPGRKE